MVHPAKNCLYRLYKNPSWQAGPPFHARKKLGNLIYKPLVYSSNTSYSKMGNLNQSKTLVNFLIVLAIALFLLGGSQYHARPLSMAKVSRFPTQNTFDSSFRTLGTMLPKGQPVPPSGPSPLINWWPFALCSKKRWCILKRLFKNKMPMNSFGCLAGT